MGCIFGELVNHKPLFPGKTELEQLELMFKLLGECIGSNTVSGWQHSASDIGRILSAGTPTAKIAPTREWKLFESYNAQIPQHKYDTVLSPREDVCIAAFLCCSAHISFNNCCFSFYSATRKCIHDT